MLDEYVVVDIETTGLSYAQHKITEIAAVKVKDGKVVGEFSQLVNPQVSIPRFITRLTGIDNAMVKDAPPIDKVMPQFLDFIGAAPLVAHNAGFDYGFLSHNSASIGKKMCNDTICTRRLASRILPDLPSKRLGAICEHLGIQNEQAHRALGDTRATAQVFAHFLETLSACECKDVVAFQGLSLPKAHALVKQRR